jgi:DNA-binding MarR family transcriptional regulator
VIHANMMIMDQLRMARHAILKAFERTPEAQTKKQKMQGRTGKDLSIKQSSVTDKIRQAQSAPIDAEIVQPE